MENVSKKIAADMPLDEFEKEAVRTVEWIKKYFEDFEKIPVLSEVNPGDIKSNLPKTAPEEGVEFSQLLQQFDEKIFSGITHWNHPGFMAYFNSSASRPGILAELLMSALNVNGMNWKSSPAATELEEVTLNWLKKMLHFPEPLWGIIYDTASSSTLHGLAAAREQVLGVKFRENGFTGFNKKLKVYTTEFTHNSVDKACLLLGVGKENIVKVPCDDKFGMNPEKLEELIIEDLKENLPMCVVPTIGTTSLTSFDPLEKIASICQKYNIWLHVDAAHGGMVSVLPEKQHLFKGLEFADSIVVNPHKWMFLPMDISVLYVKKPAILKQAFSLSAEYLKTDTDDDVINYMDYGIPLGRRFRSLKLWFALGYFGSNGIENIIREHVSLAKYFEGKINESTNFELFCDVNFSTVCFSLLKTGCSEDELNLLNKNLMDKINSTGKVFLSHTKVKNKFIIRLVISSIRINKEYLDLVWGIIKEEAENIKL